MDFDSSVGKINFTVSNCFGFTSRSRLRNNPMVPYVIFVRVMKSDETEVVKQLQILLSGDCALSMDKQTVPSNTIVSIYFILFPLFGLNDSGCESRIHTKLHQSHDRVMP